MTETAEIQLENYILEEEIGRGNLTTVYRALRKSDHAVVAIKVARPEMTADEDYVRRFKEATAQAAKLEHPNIARTYEADQEGDLLYVVREFIEARSLAQAVRESGPFSSTRMLIVAKQISAALDYAHQKSITHGDLSANRVYLGLNDHTTVADFAQTQAIAGTSLTQRGIAVGSPEIIAPERVKGHGPSRQSDLYSLGVLCYQMLAGEPPFTGSAEAVLEAQAHAQGQPLHLVNPDIPLALSETISRMLSKGLELRYNTGAEFTRAMEVAIQGAAPTRSPAAAAAQWKAVGLDRTPLWRRSWVWALAGVVIVGVLLILGFSLVSVWNNSRFNAADVPQPETISSSPSPVMTGGDSDASQAESEEPPAPAVVELVETPITSADLTPTISPTPTDTPTPLPLPTPGPPTIAGNSPFTNLVLAHNLSGDQQPERIGVSFAPGSEPIYLFFDYENIEAGTAWGHRWQWGDTELDAFQDVWPERYSPSGTAWVFFKPKGGYQPGPYQVTLEIEGQTVATATFVVQTGGL